MPLNSSDQQPIVDAHNAYRSDSSVKAQNLVWDSTLATGAQTWADNLATNVHQLQHSAPSSRQGLGENIASATAGSNTAAQMVDFWGKTVVPAVNGRSEQAQFKPGIFPNVSKDGGTVGHYTQVIWGATAKVGCGFASDGTNDYLVCRYSPQGNVAGVGVPYPQPVPAVQVSCGSSANIWSVDAANNLASYSSSDGTTWTQTQMPGTMKQVSAASDNTVYGLDPNGAPWYFDWTSYAWKQATSGPVAFISISCGAANNIWAVGTDNYCYQNTGSGWTKIVPLPGAGAQGGKQLSVAADGTTWWFDVRGMPARYTGNNWDWSASAPTGWTFTQLSCADANTLWVIGQDSKFYKSTGTAWTQVAPGTGKQVSVASDGTAWSIGTDNYVYRLVNNAWTKLLV